VYRRQARRRRAALVALIVASLVLISISFSEAEGPVHSVQRGVSAVLAPVGEGADRALKPARDLFDWFGETFDARGENERLRGELAKLRSGLA
jgi:rod shape-determining protein MreC